MDESFFFGGGVPQHKISDFAHIGLKCWMKYWRILSVFHVFFLLILNLNFQKIWCSFQSSLGKTVFSFLKVFFGGSELSFRKGKRYMYDSSYRTSKHPCFSVIRLLFVRSKLWKWPLFDLILPSCCRDYCSMKIENFEKEKMSCDRGPPLWSRSILKQPFLFDHCVFAHIHLKNQFWFSF